MERVKGVMSKPCATCGADRVGRAQRDGGVTYGPCESCQPSASRSQAAAEDPNQGRESIIRSTGTDIEE